MFCKIVRKLQTKVIGALPQTPLKVLFREITSAQVPSRILRILKKLIQRDFYGSASPPDVGKFCFVYSLRDAFRVVARGAEPSQTPKFLPFSRSPQLLGWRRFMAFSSMVWDSSPGQGGWGVRGRETLAFEMVPCPDPRAGSTNPTPMGNRYFLSHAFLFFNTSYNARKLSCRDAGISPFFTARTMAQSASLSLV